MDAAGRALEEGSRVSVVKDRAEIPESLENGSDGVRLQLAGVSLSIVVESSQGDLPGNSNRPPPLKPKDSSGSIAQEATGQNLNVSSVIGDADNSGLDQDVEKGKVETKTVVIGTDSEASPSYHQQDSEESQCRVCHMSTATADAINLGCNCKLDLGRVHKGCAEKWFKVRGNRTCEICGQIAQNVQLVADSSCQADGQDIVIANNFHHGSRLLFLRSAGICLLWVAFIIFLYKYLLPILRKMHQGQPGN